MDEQQSQPQPQQPQQPQQPAEQKPKGSKSLMIWGTILVVVIVGVVIWYLLK